VSSLETVTMKKKLFVYSLLRIYTRLDGLVNQVADQMAVQSRGVALSKENEKKEGSDSRWNIGPVKKKAA